MVALALLSGCSGDEGTDPGEVVGTALDRDSLLRPPIGPTEVEVTSLGFNDAVLERRTVAIDARTHRDVLEALAGAPGDRRSPGLVGLSRGLEFGETDPGGAIADTPDRLEAVTGRIEARDLSRALQRAGAGGTGVEGLGGVDRNLVRADFILYTAGSQYDFRGLDLILVQDDPDNALPPTRIRFRLAAPDRDPAVRGG